MSDFKRVKNKATTEIKKRFRRAPSIKDYFTDKKNKNVDDFFVESERLKKKKTKFFKEINILETEEELLRIKNSQKENIVLKDQDQHIKDMITNYMVEVLDDIKTPETKQLKRYTSLDERNKNHKLANEYSRFGLIGNVRLESNEKKKLTVNHSNGLKLSFEKMLNEKSPSKRKDCKEIKLSWVNHGSPGLSRISDRKKKEPQTDIKSNFYFQTNYDLETLEAHSFKLKNDILQEMGDKNPDSKEGAYENSMMGKSPSDNRIFIDSNTPGERFLRKGYDMTTEVRIE